MDAPGFTLGILMSKTEMQITDLAPEINEAHHMARVAAESAVEHAIRCGELLIQQKKRLKHGQFVDWVKEHCDFSYPSAVLYMRSTRHKDKALSFSSLSQLLTAEKVGDNPGAPPKPRYAYEEAIQPDFELPPGHDPRAWQMRKGDHRAGSPMS
jgi:hypothetical protein